MRWQILVGPKAWNPSLWRSVEQALVDHDLAYDLHRTATASDVQQAVDRARGAGHGHFVAMGGDGAMNIVLNAVLAEPWDDPPVLGALPAGTGSDFIRMFAIPQNTIAAVAHLAGERVYRSDVGLLEGSWGVRYFLNVAQLGIGGAAVKRSEKLRFLGPARYQIGFWSSLPTFQPRQISVRAGDRLVESPALMVVIANGQFFGRGYNIAPKATVTDGLADVQIFSVERRSVPAVFAQVRTGNHLRRPDVRRLQAQTVNVSAERPTPVEADGEYLGTGSFTASILPGMIDFKM